MYIQTYIYICMYISIYYIIKNTYLHKYICHIHKSRTSFRFVLFHDYVYIYTYIYTYTHTHTHIKLNIYIYIYIYI